MLCVGRPLGTLCVPFDCREPNSDTERPGIPSHAEHGTEGRGQSMGRREESRAWGGGKKAEHGTEEESRAWDGGKEHGAEGKSVGRREESRAWVGEGGLWQAVFFLRPMLCVGRPLGTLCVPFDCREPNSDAERPGIPSHAEHGTEGKSMGRRKKAEHGTEKGAERGAEEGREERVRKTPHQSFEIGSSPGTSK